MPLVCRKFLGLMQRYNFRGFVAQTCSNYYSCNSCTAVSGCGWCRATGTCQSGSSSGAYGYCSYGWSYTSFDCGGMLSFNVGFGKSRSSFCLRVDTTCGYMSTCSGCTAVYFFEMLFAFLSDQIGCSWHLAAGAAALRPAKLVSAPARALVRATTGDGTFLSFRSFVYLFIYLCVLIVCSLSPLSGRVRARPPPAHRTTGFSCTTSSTAAGAVHRAHACRARSRDRRPVTSRLDKRFRHVCQRMGASSLYCYICMHVCVVCVSVQLSPGLIVVFVLVPLAVVATIIGLIVACCCGCIACCQSNSNTVVRTTGYTQMPAGGVIASTTYQPYVAQAQPQPAPYYNYAPGPQQGYSAAPTYNAAPATGYGAQTYQPPVQQQPQEYGGRY